MAIRNYKIPNIIILSVVVLAFIVLMFWGKIFKSTQEVAKPITTAKKAASAEPTPDVPAAVAERYKALAASLDMGRVKTDITTLSSYPSRIVGYPGCESAAEYIEKQFKSIGLNGVETEKFKVTVPIDEGSKLVVNGREFPVYSLWPNLVRTSHLPPEGLNVHIIDAKSGRLPDFDGKVVAGSAAMVDFNSGTEWLNAPRLGAKALLFIEPDSTMRGEAEAKFSAIPVSMPRFWISKDTAAKLRVMLTEINSRYTGLDPNKRPRLNAKIYCKMPWEKVEAKNIVGIIPGTDPKLRKQWIVLHSYYDGTSVVPSIAPSAETTCGIATMLELARIYKNPKFAPRRSVMFVATSGHFQGLAGMRSFIERHIDSYVFPGGLDNIHAWLNKYWPMKGHGLPSPIIPALVCIIILLITMVVWNKLKGVQRRLPWVVAVPIVLVVITVTLTGFLQTRFSKGFDYKVPHPKQFYLWAGLDLSSQTQGVGIFYKGYFYDFREDIQGKFSDLAGRSRENSERIASVLGFYDQRTARFADGVNPISGKNWRNFVPGKFALDSEVVTLAGGEGVSFVSIDDGRQLVDTPIDTENRINFDNLGKQIEMITCITDHWFRDINTQVDEETVRAKVIDSNTVQVKDPLTLGYVQGVYTNEHGRGRTYYKPKDEKQLPADANGKIKLSESLPAGTKIAYILHKPLTKLGVAEPSKFTRMGLQGGFARLSGNVVEYDPRKSFVPNLRVGDCLAVVRSAHKSFMGVRANIIDKTTPVYDTKNPTRNQGYFEIPGVAPLTAYGWQKMTDIGAYKLDPVNGDIICAPDQGSYGEFYPTTFPITTGYKDMPIIVFNCKATSVYDLIDPQSLRALSGMSVYDGETNAAPKQFGLAVAVPEPQNPHVEDMAVIFTEDTQKSGSKATASSTELKRIRLKVIMAAGPAANRLLLLNSTLGNEIISEKVADIYKKAIPIDSAWMPAITGVYRDWAGKINGGKSYYQQDLTGADNSMLANGVVSLDPEVFAPKTHGNPINLSNIYIKTNQGKTFTAKLFKIITVSKPWYEPIKAVYLDKDGNGPDYYMASMNKQLSESLGTSEVCVRGDFPDSVFVKDPTKADKVIPRRVVDNIYAKLADGRIIRASVNNIAVKANLNENPIQIKIRGIYESAQCSGRNLMASTAGNNTTDALNSGGPIVLDEAAGKTVWIKTNQPHPIKAKVASFVKIDDPLQIFVNGVYADPKCRTKNLCVSKNGLYNSSSLLTGEIQLTSDLPAGAKDIYIRPFAQAEGIGYDVTDGGTIEETAYKVARDMWILDQSRLNTLESKGIINEGLSTLHGQAKRFLDMADHAKGSLNYSVFDSYCRAAWGYEARAYPGVTSTSQDVVNGVIFYLFLILPFAFFIERLFFAFPELTKQLLAFFVIFCLIFLIFYFVHPAFQIGCNAPIVLDAFIMLALSILTIFIIASKFEEQLKALNQSMSGVHKADIGRMSVAAAAFSLGISNMRRRKARTVLTCITLVLLTFTVLSFTSIVSVLRFNKVPSKKDPDTSVYQGIMIRSAMWESLQELAYRIMKDEFGNEGKRGKVYPVAPRAWFYGTTLGEQSFLTLRKGDLSYDARAAAGMSPDEARIMDFEGNGKNRRAFVAGDWFGYKNGKRIPGPVNPYSMIIPDVIADKLGIQPSDVGKAQVAFGGAKYTIIAIIKNDIFKKIKDLDNEPLTPVDFIMMSKQSSQQQSGGEAGFREYIHHEPSNCFIVPYDTLMGMGGELKSIAIKYISPEEVQKQLDLLMPRLGLNLYAGVGNSIYRYSSIAASSSKGFSNVFIPVLIAALIVLNTMLGSVFERVKEIGIFSSIGLAPNHIAVLFIAESMVYANLGAVAGYVIGQTVSKILMATNLMPGLYLNFSSMSAVTSTIVVVAVVLLSTLYPARKASEVATPAIDRSWKVPDPVGDDWDIVLPFAVTGQQAVGVNGFLKEWLRAYEEYSIGDFVTQDVQTGDNQSEFGRIYWISCKAWLAPFDLGVSQKVRISTEPTDMEQVYEVKLRLTRESGDISNWKRVNRRFLNTLRKQFLIWRTLRVEERDKYLAAAEAASSGEGIGPEVTPA